MMDSTIRRGLVCFAAACAAWTGAVPTADASVISVNTRFSASGPQASAAAYKALVDGLVANPPTAGYCDATPSVYDNISNQVTCGGGFTNIAFHMHVDFGVSSALAGVWNIRIGPDFGLGGALFIDGVAVAFNSADMWWNGSYADPSQILTAALPLSAGNHTIDVYGLEGCCDGAQQGQFLLPGAADYQTFSVRDGLNGVPEPATLALLGLGLAGLGYSRRKR